MILNGVFFAAGRSDLPYDFRLFYTLVDLFINILIL